MPTLNITLSIDSKYVPAFRAYILANHPEADTNKDGIVTGEEAVAWLKSSFQEVINSFIVERSVEWAEKNAPEMLPPAYREKLAVLEAATGALRKERHRITSG